MDNVRKSVFIISFFAACLISNACVQAQQIKRRGDVSTPSEKTIMVSLIQLIAAPEKYAGKRVQIVGYLHLEFEGDRICLHKEDSDKDILHNCLSIGSVNEAGKMSKKNMHKFSNNYVLMEGVFNRDEDEIYAFDSGELKDINRVESWDGRQ